MKLGWLLWLTSVLSPQQADQTCLAATVYLEARSESTLGQLAVAEVALRRRDSGRWGNTLCDVLNAPGQFALSTTSKDYIFRNSDSWQEAWLIAKRSMQMWDLPRNQRTLVVPHADHFIAADSTAPSWITGPPLATIGGHNFYRTN